MTLRRALHVVSVVIMLAWGSGAFVQALRSQLASAGTMTVTFLLDDGRQHAIGPIEVRPALRGPWRRRELPYAGTSAMTARWEKPTSGITQLFVLTEHPGGPGTAVSLTPIRVGYPSDGVMRFRETPDPGPAQLPCVAVSAFFVDGIGAAPKGRVVAWLQEGERETAFAIEPDTSQRLRPILTVDTARVALLAGRDDEYSLEIEKSPEADDVMVVAIAIKADGELMSHLVPSALRGRSSGRLPDSREDLTWRIYALDDRRELHSHCRAVEPLKNMSLRLSIGYRVEVERQFPGFRILYSHEIAGATERAFADDTSGPVISGHFNYDGYRDFAAIAVRDYPISTPSPHQPREAAVVREGKELVCFGTAMRETFRCEAKPVTLTLPREAYLQRIPPGRYQCVTDSRPTRTVTTTIASVGAVDDKGMSTFLVRNRDGSTFSCATRP